MSSPRRNPEASEALSLVAKLHRQANGLRAEVEQLHQILAQAQTEFKDTHGARLLEANEKLVLAVLQAEAVTDTAVSDLGDLMFSSQRDALLRVAIDAARIGEWEMDLASRAIRHSLRHDMCFGHAELQAEWTIGIMLRHIHPDDRTAFEQSLQHAIQNLKAWQTTCRVIWPDGSTHWITISGGIFKDGARPARLMGIITDVTQAKLAEEAQQKLAGLELENRRMLEASRLKGQFVSHMSHELRTPLNGIIGFSDLLCMGPLPEMSAKHREFLGHIGSSARHLLHLINDILDLSKAESGKVQFYPEPVDLKQLIAELACVLHAPFQRNAIRFNVEIEPALSKVVIDPTRLKQVLYNYLSNAIKFTLAGGRVTLRAQTEGEDRFRLEVEDSGIGIFDHDLPRLFGNFNQLDAGPSKPHQGAGLGLALTRRLVEAQGGCVGVRSIPGRGSVFHVVLDRFYKGTA